MRPSKILVGIPTGWHLNALWQANLMQWIGGDRIDEIALHFEPSNTKACAYSRLIDLAREGDYDNLLLWETNILIEQPINFVLKRIQQFHCVLTPGRFIDNSIGADAIFHQDTSSLPSEVIDDKGTRELAPFEVRFGCTHLCAFDRDVIRAITATPRFTWALKDTKVDHDMPIYCYDGDTWPGHPDPEISKPDAGNPIRRLSIEQSLFSNVRAHDFGVWADPQLKTVNLRLGGSYKSLRLDELPAR